MVTPYRGILLMLLCTFFLSLSQLFQKIASSSSSTAEILFHWAFWLGLIFAGLGAILLTMALKWGDLSTLFPFISLSFVWTLLLAAFLFGEQIFFPTILGVAFVVIGVVLLGHEQVSA